jgi:hypothetical protein
MHGAQGYKVLLQGLRVTMRAITHHYIGYKVLLQGLRVTMRTISLHRCIFCHESMDKICGYG